MSKKAEAKKEEPAPEEAGEKPTFGKKLVDGHVNEGEKADFTTVVKGTAPVTCAWYKNGVKMKSSRTVKLTFLRGTARITLSECGADDIAEYKLEATNKFGTATDKASLDVTRECLRHVCFTVFIVDHIIVDFRDLTSRILLLYFTLSCVFSFYN